MDKSFIKTSVAEFDLLASIVSVAQGRPPRTSSARHSTALGSALQGEAFQELSASVADGRPSFPITAQPISIGADASQDAVVTRKMLIGLYCNYALIGIVNGFLMHSISKPICLYVFDGIQNDRVTYAQCNMGATILQMPWNFKLFYAFLVDRCQLFGKRRYWWIVCGWFLALLVLAGVTTQVQGLADQGDFTTYAFLLMATCFCYMFADVAADGLTVELSQLEPPESRGYILTTGQMVRFGSTGFVMLLSTILTNGPAMYPPKLTSSTLFSFGLNIGQVHLMLLILAVPLFIVMALCIKDAPVGEHHPEGVCQALSMMWSTLQSKAVLLMIFFSIGFIAVAGLSNPAASSIASIVVPTPILLSLSALLGQVFFLVGVWLFRRYFMARNWRFTCLGTQVLQQLETCFYLAMIYDFAGIGQSGFFYCFGDCVLYIVSGVAQVLSSLAVIEIARPGLESTTYEMLTTIHNCAIAFNTNIGNSFLPVFNLNAINHDSYKNATLAQKDEFNSDMFGATMMTFGAQLGGTLVFMWFLPKDREMCRRWRDDEKYHKRWVGILGLAVGVVVFLYSTCLSFLSLFPATRCLKIAGGEGCD